MLLQEALQSKVGSCGEIAWPRTVQGVAASLSPVKRGDVWVVLEPLPIAYGTEVVSGDRFVTAFN